MTQQARERELSEPVLVRMRDDELIEGLPVGFDLDHPDFELRVSDAASNNRQALIPFAAVKCVVLSRRDADGEPGGDGHLHGSAQKVVIRYWDGETVKGFVRHSPSRHRHAVEIEVRDQALGTVETLAIPHAAIKGIFYVKAWDGRAGEFFPETGHWEPRRSETPLVDLLSEIRNLGRLRDGGRLTQQEFVRRRRYVLERI